MPVPLLLEVLKACFSWAPVQAIRLLAAWVPYLPVEHAMEPALTLAIVPWDLQITICTFLHPSDILALRKVCH